jgi:DNA invertase Pin-like site-specific DNA recombinase
VTRIGYGRVSTTDQNLDRQADALQAAGVTRIFMEQISGATTARPQLDQLLDYVREGDTVVVTSFDRLARSARDLLSIIDTLKDKKAEFISLKEHVDTTTPTGRFMLTIFAAVAELERDNIKARQAEGIQAAKARGKKLGRPERFVFDHILDKVRAGEMTRYRAAKLMNVPYSTLTDHLKRGQNQSPGPAIMIGL